MIALKNALNKRVEALVEPPVEEAKPERVRVSTVK